VPTGSERETLLEPAKLDRLAQTIVVEGTTTTVAELGPDSLAPAEAVGRWRQAAADYDAARCRPGGATAGAERPFAAGAWGVAPRPFCAPWKPAPAALRTARSGSPASATL
jgi:hypothetical protein